MVSISGGSMIRATGKHVKRASRERYRAPRLSASVLTFKRRYYGWQAYEKEYNRVLLAIKWREDELKEFCNYVLYGIQRKYGHLRAVLHAERGAEAAPQVRRLNDDMQEELLRAKRLFGYDGKMRKVRELKTQVEFILRGKANAERDFEKRYGFNNTVGRG